jgi:hypothetical protein
MGGTSKNFFEMAAVSPQHFNKSMTPEFTSHFPLPDNKLTLDAHPMGIFPQIIQSAATPQAAVARGGGPEEWRRSLYPTNKEYEQMIKLKQLMQNTIGPFHQPGDRAAKLSFKEKLA